MAMMRARRCVLVLLVALAACNKVAPQESLARAVAAPPMRAQAMAGGAVAEPAAMLAYEHEARIELQADRIDARLQAVRAACTGRRFGDCVILNVQQEGGEEPSASLGMRLAPAGVEHDLRNTGDGVLRVLVVWGEPGHKDFSSFGSLAAGLATRGTKP